MTILIYLLSILFFRWSSSDSAGTHPMIKKIESKNYSLEYLSNGRKTIINSNEELETFLVKGFVLREEDYLVSKSANGDHVVIVEDSACLFVRNDAKSIHVGPIDVFEPLLFNPSLDPYAILDYGKRNGKSKEFEVTERETRVKFVLPKASFFVSEIRFIFPNDDTATFSIEMVYYQRATKVSEVTKYKLAMPLTITNKEKIDYYLLRRDGKFNLRTEFQSYKFSNTYELMESLRALGKPESRDIVSKYLCKATEDESRVFIYKRSVVPLCGTSSTAAILGRLQRP